MAKKKTTQPEDSTPQTDAPAPARRSTRRAAPPRTRSKTPSVAEMADPIHTADDMSAASGVPSRQEIAEAAYHRYLNRGGGDGRDFDDWLEAERELRGRS